MILGGQLLWRPAYPINKCNLAGFMASAASGCCPIDEAVQKIHAFFEFGGFNPLVGRVGLRDVSWSAHNRGRARVR